MPDEHDARLVGLAVVGDGVGGALAAPAVLEVLAVDDFSVLLALEINLARALIWGASGEYIV